jgi:hypothetical protein
VDLPKLRKGQLLLPKMPAALFVGAQALDARLVCVLASALLLSKTSFKKRGSKCLESESCSLVTNLKTCLHHWQNSFFTASHSGIQFTVNCSDLMKQQNVLC